ncbi:MAG: hypothetical protein WKF34_02945 [Pyrinomonadaceae bacterium]
MKQQTKTKVAERAPHDVRSTPFDGSRKATHPVSGKRVPLRTARAGSHSGLPRNRANADPDDDDVKQGHSLQDNRNDILTDVDKVEVPIDSLEAAVGYSSLMRQMHKAFVRRVAFYRSASGGSLAVEEAREKAFHAPADKEEVDHLISEMLRLPLDCLSFIDLQNLQAVAPQSAEAFWELVKEEGRKEFESGHLAANTTFPVGYMKEVWNIARYLGVRESFISEWQPHGGIEIGLIDMMTQSYFQWQFWLEQTVKRSQTRAHEHHPQYSEWMAEREKEFRVNGWIEGFWARPLVSEQQAIEHAVLMAERWNRTFMRTLRQLRDLRRYSQVTINNANQVNIATEGGKQVNMKK